MAVTQTIPLSRATPVFTDTLKTWKNDLDALTSSVQAFFQHRLFSPFGVAGR